MAKHNIEKNTTIYRISAVFINWAHNLFYREHYSINRPNKKNKVPAIITPNHQNGLMDALAILNAKQEPLVFLARSDIFKTRIQTSILYFLKILPIFRIRDGFDSLKNNQETFDHTVRVLKNHRSLVILPEGSHYGAKKLRPLKKGFARIAFMTEIYGKENINLQILPVSIDYTAYDTFFTRLTVVFGKPFPIKPYLNEYKENAPIALNKITNHLTDELKELIIHVENETYHDQCVSASAIYAEYKQKEFVKRFECQRNVTQTLNTLETKHPESFSSIVEQTRELKKSTGKIPDEIIGKNTGISSIFNLFLSILLIPIALPGTILYGLFWYWPVWFTNKNIQDVQFRTSFRFVIYIVQFLILLLIIFILSISILPFAQALIVFIMAVVSGILSMKIWRVFYWNLLKTKWYIISKRTKSIQILRKKLIDLIDKEIKD